MLFIKSILAFVIVHLLNFTYFVRFKLAEVQATVDSTIGFKVSDVKTNPTKSSTVKKSARKGGKVLSASSSDTSEVLAPPSEVRQSTRKRVPINYSEEKG